jgi:predicted TIM-barrel fold metal-dependent hydrolase
MLLRMVVAGVFEDLPDLKVIVGHMGEGIPFHLARIEDMFGPLLSAHERTVTETLTSNLYLTTSAYVSDPPLQCALETFGSRHVLFSVDYPMANTQRAVDHLRATPVLTAEVRELVAHKNAASLLRI